MSSMPTGVSFDANASPSVASGVSGASGATPYVAQGPSSSTSQSVPPPPSPGAIPRPSPPAVPPVTRLLATYSLLSPNSKAVADSALARERSSRLANEVHFLPFSLDDDAPIITPDAKVIPISKLIDNLANAGFHIPLSLFTFDSLSKLQGQSHLSKTVKVHHKGQNLYVLDLSQFPPEADMQPLDLYSAWERYLEWIGRHKGPATKRMWAAHFRFLARKSEFLDNFPAILQFDIDIRCEHASDPSVVISMHQYKEHFLQLQLSGHCNPTIDPSSSLDKSSKSQHPSPYNRKLCRDSTDDSFWNNQRSGPTCLICQCIGHKYSNCSEEVTTKGAQTFARSRDGKLVRKDNGSPICFPFQLAAAKRPCRENHPDQHVCSTCRSQDHGASNHKLA